MDWNVEWSEPALRDLARLDPKMGRRIFDKVGDTASDPARFYSRLVGSDEHKLRVGDHRVIVRLSSGTRTIIVQKVDHRSRVYR